MKRVLGINLHTGINVGLLHAEALNESDRRAYQFVCPHDGCKCTYHWRKPHEIHANTEHVYATFVKNPGSAQKPNTHIANCTNDFERIVRENRKYVTMVDGKPYVRINFALGSAYVDRRPGAYLQEHHKAAAEGHDHIKPFSSLKELAKFIEKNFGGLDSVGAAEITVAYQGQTVSWGALFKGSDEYAKLNTRARNYKFDNEGKTITRPIITIVKPVKEISLNDNGKRRFECESQFVRTENQMQYVIPVIVCENIELAKKIEEMMDEKETICIASRPFNPGPSSMPARFKQQRVSLYIHDESQICTVDSRLWKLSHKKENQLDLFAKTPELALAL